MKSDLPAIIHEVGFDFNWDNSKVWQLDVPVEDMLIDKLIWHLDYPFIWPIPAGHKEVTPKQVLADPKKHSKEYQRTINADTTFPIDIMFWKNKWLILDGLHRLMQQVDTGREIVKVRKIPKSVIPKIRKD